MEDRSVAGLDLGVDGHGDQDVGLGVSLCIWHRGSQLCHEDAKQERTLITGPARDSPELLRV